MVFRLLRNRRSRARNPLLVAALLTGVLVTFAHGQEPFDSFPAFSSKAIERLHLDNYAFYLLDHPDTIAYLIFYVGRDGTLKRVRERVSAAKYYLIRMRGVDAKRIKVVYKGLFENTSTIVLQPLDKKQML
jgi:hypothetical protein